MNFRGGIIRITSLLPAPWEQACAQSVGLPQHRDPMYQVGTRFVDKWTEAADCKWPCASVQTISSVSSIPLWHHALPHVKQIPSGSRRHRCQSPTSLVPHRYPKMWLYSSSGISLLVVTPAPSLYPLSFAGSEFIESGGDLCRKGIPFPHQESTKCHPFIAAFMLHSTAQLLPLE